MNSSMNTIGQTTYLAIYISDNEHLEKYLPLLNVLNRPVLLLCASIVEDDVEVNENISAIAIEDMNDDMLEKLQEVVSLDGLLLADNNGVLLHHLQHLKFPVITLNPSVAQDKQIAIINKEAPCCYLKKASVPKLHIGCGPFVIEGWLNTDVQCNYPEVSYLNAGKLYPFPDNSFEYIFSEHLFEHLSIVEQTVMLEECYRILKPGGRVRLAMPNLHFIMDLYNHPNKEYNRKYLEWSYRLFGIRKDTPKVSEVDYPIHVINNFFHLWGHQFIHTPESLERMACEIGFKDIKPYPIGCSDTPTLQGLEKHGQSIPSWANELETFVVEMGK